MDALAGSLTPGKDADLVILTGDPLKISTWVETTLVRGQVVYERKLDVSAERERLQKELAKFEQELANAQRQLGNEKFLSKAPPNVVDGLRTRASELQLLQQKTQRALDELR